MPKKIASILICLTALISLTACGGKVSEKQTAAQPKGKLTVYVSFNAIKEFVKAVGGDRVEVTAMVPDGMEAHDFEPKAMDIAGLGKAMLFVFNGYGMENWAETAVNAAGNKSLIVVDSSKGVDPIAITGDNELKERGKYDPHIWLSLNSAQTQAKNIKDALIKADAESKDYYEKNYASFASQLESLYNEYKEKFKSLPKKDFVTGHAAFAYLCRDFGLNQKSVEDVFAEGEPSAQKLAALVDFCRKNKVTTIFAEEMASPEVSKTLARDLGAKVETIHTIESADNSKSYIERMRENIQKIYDSLKA